MALSRGFGTRINQADLFDGRHCFDDQLGQHHFRPGRCPIAWCRPGAARSIGFQHLARGTHRRSSGPRTARKSMYWFPSTSYRQAPLGPFDKEWVAPTAPKARSRTIDPAGDNPLGTQTMLHCVRNSWPLFKGPRQWCRVPVTVLVPVERIWCWGRISQPRFGKRRPDPGNPQLISQLGRNSVQSHTAGGGATAAAPPIAPVADHGHLHRLTRAVAGLRILAAISKTFTGPPSSPQTTAKELPEHEASH